MAHLPDPDRATRGHAAQQLGMRAEDACGAALEADGWTILARRLRTPAGELDLVAEREGMLAFIEVKSRRTLAGAASALDARQRARLLAAADAALAANPHWTHEAVRFDVMLVNRGGQVRRIADAFRQE